MSNVTWGVTSGTRQVRAPAEKTLDTLRKVITDPIMMPKINFISWIIITFEASQRQPGIETFLIHGQDEIVLNLFEDSLIPL